MNITINGRGSISAAGSNTAEAASVFDADGPSTWSIDEETGLPVYRIHSIPAHERIDAFRQKRNIDRSSLLALHAADQAVTEAGWQEQEFAILVGSSRGPTENWEQAHDYFRETGKAKLRTSPETTLGGIGFALSAFFGTASVATSLSVTCSSGFHALLHGIALLTSGMAERVLVGGAEAPITLFTLRQLEALGVYASAPDSNDAQAVSDWEKQPGGMVLGEGAAFVALSKSGTGSLITGLGFAQERSPSLTGISRDGLALQQSMQQALRGGDHSIDLVVVHAPGTARGNAAEYQAVEKVFGKRMLELMSSGKHKTGHTFGASGPLGLDYALNVLDAGKEDFCHAIINATGFGGNAVSVVVKKN